MCLNLVRLVVRQDKNLTSETFILGAKTSGGHSSTHCVRIFDA